MITIPQSPPRRTCFPNARRRRSERGQDGYVHPYIITCVNRIIERTLDNVEHDRDLADGATPHNTCVMLGVPLACRRVRGEHVISDSDTEQDDDAQLIKDALLNAYW